MTTQRYTAIAVLLHWAIALALLGQILMGWWMGDAMGAPATQAQGFAAIQLHKSIGLTILILSLIRLGWRFTHQPPPLPEGMPAWEVFGARASHWLFYIIIVVFPLSGWLYVSTGWSAFDHRPLDVPTMYFGLIHVPHLFALDHAAIATRQGLGEAFMFTHEKLAWATLALLALHIAAALKHHFVDRDETLTHMVPGLKAPNGAEAPAPDPRRRNLLIAGFVLIALAGVAWLYAFANPPLRAAAAPPPAQQQATLDTTFADTSANATTTTAATTGAAAPTPSGPPPTWRVDQAHSAITFTGGVLGAAFDGSVGRWRADIRFDPANLAASATDAVIEANSIRTGDAQRDASLAQSEWFDTGAHADITFRATRFRALGGDRYEAIGPLTIKGVSQQIRLPFTLHIGGAHASMRGEIQLDRLAFQLGAASFPGDDQVQHAVNVAIHIEATRAP